MATSRFSTLCAAAPITLVLGALTACGTGYPIGAEHAKPVVLVDAERDLSCPQSQITVEEQWGGKWLAVGCGRKQLYNANCTGVRCEVRREEEGPVPLTDRPTP